MGNSAAVISSSFENLDKQVTNQFIPAKLTHGCNLFLQNTEASEVFVNYLRSGVWTKKMSMPGFTPLMQKEEDPADSSEPLASHDEIEGYSLPSGSKASGFKVKEDNFETKSATDIESIIETCFSMSEMKAVLLASLFPIFLESQEYQGWLDRQEQVASRELQLPRENSVEKREQRLDELFQPKTRRLNEIISSAMSTVDNTEIYRMLNSGSWLSNLLSTVEDLPLCVSLATARLDRPGFPLVYVNKAFETITGYDRSDIVGQNCRFLQSEETEREQIGRLSYALKHALPTKVVITNKRKDDTTFLNLLAIKPVFSMDGVYSFVIGVQYDVTNREASRKEIQQVDDLLSILPNILK